MGIARRWLVSFSGSMARGGSFQAAMSIVWMRMLYIQSFLLWVKDICASTLYTVYIPAAKVPAFSKT